MFDSPYLNEIPEGIDSLFHYTDAGGIIGMVQHKSLWLTNIHYLNDSEEYYYAFDLVKRILDEEYSGLVSMADLPRDRTSTVFSFSLSEESDLLSQWRGYCPNGGFSISFDRLEFNKVIQQEGLRVAKCIYNETEQREYIIKNVIGFAPSEYQAAKDHEKETFVRIPHEMFSLSKKIIKRISDIAPILKELL